MDRPFVVCHMLASLDGKIDGTFFGAPEAASSVKAYGELRGYYNCPATLYGTSTMLGGYADGYVSALPKARKKLPNGDYIDEKGKEVGNFIVSMDPEEGALWLRYKTRG